MSLYPVFFGVAGCRLAFPGWQRKNWTDVWTTEEVTGQMLNVGIGNEMQITRLKPDASFGLIRISDALRVKPTLNFGDRVEIKDHIALHPYTDIYPGERGVVGRTETMHGEVTIYLEHYHPGLEETGNTLWLIPHMTDGLLPCVRVWQPPERNGDERGVEAQVA